MFGVDQIPARFAVAATHIRVLKLKDVRNNLKDTFLRSLVDFDVGMTELRRAVAVP